MKLLSACREFSFLYFVRARETKCSSRAVKNMSKPDHNWPKEIIVPLAKPFVDARGVIQPLVDVAMESAMIISSKKGSVRANHYRKHDWHYCYLISGSIDYYHRPVGSKEKPERVTA